MKWIYCVIPDHICDMQKCSDVKPRFYINCNVILNDNNIIKIFSQLIRYSKACDSYHDFLDRGLLLTRKLLNHGFLLVKLKLSRWKFYDRHHDLVDRYGKSVSQMTTDVFHFS